MPGRLAGKTAIVTGSSSGLGRAIAHAYAADGAQVCCADLYPNLRNPINSSTGKADDINNRITTGTPTHISLIKLYPLQSHHGPNILNHIFVTVDVTNAASVEALVKECVSHFGRLDIMVNNAGISVESTHTRVTRCHETLERDWDKTMAVNAKGVFLGCKYALGQMLVQEPWGQEAGDEMDDRRDRGWIVNTASVQGMVGYWGTPSYAASKAAVLNLTRQLALDYGRDRIHVNALCPGFLKTAMTQNLQSEPETLQRISAAHPLGGMGEPEDVARMAVVLASEDVKWVTGLGVAVDGGYLCL